jgi:hypothetical protein
MASENVAIYCWNDFGPGKIKDNIAKLQQSGVTTAILWAVHVGSPNTPKRKQKYGDLIYNDDPPNLFVSQNKFNPGNSPQIAAWPGLVAQLKQGGSSVSKIFLSIGGGDGVQDFTTIEYMLTHGMTETLIDNLTALRDAFKVNGTCVIDGIDLDCEESVHQDTIPVFSQILFNLGFEVTFCPYDYQDRKFWQTCMQKLWDLGLKVSWWNLQCYSGGNFNRTKLPDWISTLAGVVGKDAAPSFLWPGLAVMGSGTNDQCPDGICTTFAGWSKLGLGGGWLWRYDDIGKRPCSVPADLAAYVTAIKKGLSNKCT